MDIHPIFIYWFARMILPPNNSLRLSDKRVLVNILFAKRTYEKKSLWQVLLQKKLQYGYKNEILKQ